MTRTAQTSEATGAPRSQGTPASFAAGGGTASGPAVVVRGLVKHYGEQTVVDEVDLNIERGQIFSLLGPNGAGKTTTVEILEGYRRRDAGEVRVLGLDPARPTPAWRARIGIVMQSSEENAELTVEEMVRHFARYYPDPRDVDEVIAATGLEEKRKSRTRTLSGGQRRRLDVALGVIGRPELLFLDEPTTGFDPQARRAFWELIHSLRNDGTTILLTTHYLDEAEHLADVVSVIANGRVLATGRPQDLGGEAAHRTRVRWSDANGEHEEITEHPTQVVRELVTRHPGEIPDLQVIRPSLEDVYLSLIGSQE